MAVEAAQKAFDTTWGLNTPGSVRADLLWKLAQLMERDKLQLAALEALDNGKNNFLILIVISDDLSRQNIQLGTWCRCHFFYFSYQVFRRLV